MSTKGDKKTITRSPGYPAFSLEEAVKKVRTIYEADKIAGTPVSAGLKYMGFKASSGPANAALAALKKYGLIAVSGGRITPTQRAVSILILPEQDMRRKTALQEAALAPHIYEQYFARFKEQGMPSAESLEHELLLGGKFNHNAIKSFVDDFRKTLEFAGLTNADGVILSDRPEDIFNTFGLSEKPQDDPLVKPERKPKERSMPANTKEDVFTLDEGSVVLQWPQSMSAESYADFEGWIQLVLRKVKRSIANDEDAKND